MPVIRQFPHGVRFDRPPIVRLQLIWDRIMEVWFWAYCWVIVFACFVRALHRDE